MMRELAALSALAKSDPRRAARALLAHADPATVELLLDAGAWKDQEVESFERERGAVLIEGARFGRFWLAADSCPRALVPPAPRLSPRGVVALARAAADVFLKEVVGHA